MSMQNPLARARGKGSSGGGVHHWRSQRYSSLVLLLTTAWILWLGVSLAGADYATASAAMSSPVNAGMAILMAGAIFYHTQLGMQVVIGVCPSHFCSFCLSCRISDQCHCCSETGCRSLKHE